ncbi:small GTP-binding protein domain-containing protein [Lachnospiraceae bacterium NE2001]|nr:small GTP-binding protein domain-containing protein [Lachnospiraceae bacterium NE2001]
MENKERQDFAPPAPIAGGEVPVYEGTIEKPNVVVVGNSGVGKSTLINSLFQTYVAETSIGEATTKELRVYETDALSFRIIDTIGFEPGVLNQSKAIAALRKWSKDSIKNEDPTHQISMIWYCIDGTSRKMFKKNIDMLARATSVWKSVPIIVVITKSYSKPEREENIRMVYHAFKSHSKLSENLKAIVPVVAATYKIDADLNINVTPDGLGELLAETVKYLPEGVSASLVDKNYFYLQQKRGMAHSVVGASALAGLTVGLVPIPFPDGTILTPLEVGEIKSLSKIYGVEFDKNTELIQTIINAGTAGIVAKTALNAIKAIPGLNIAGDVLNGIVAGVIVAALGEGSVYIFEQIYTGQKSVADTEWVKNFLDSKVASGLTKNINTIVKEYTELLSSGKKVTAKDVMIIIMKNMKIK